MTRLAPVVVIVAAALALTFAACSDDDGDAGLPTATTTEPTTTTEAPDTTEETGTTTTTAGTTTTVDQAAIPVVSGRDPVPVGVAAEHTAAAEACFDGDMVACDELFETTAAGSVDEAFGDTCGGRIADGRGLDLACDDVIADAADVPADIADAATAGQCAAGDMLACDELYRTAAQGSVDQAYGALCGYRVQNTDALCVDIFGTTAFT